MIPREEQTTGVREEFRAIGLFKKNGPTVGTKNAAPVADKEAARVCLVAADKYIKDGQFDKAKVELDKAKKYDPTNVYIDAFKDRIVYFEQMQKRDASRRSTGRAEVSVDSVDKKGLRKEEAERHRLEEGTADLADEKQKLDEEKKYFEEQLRKIQEEAREKGETDALKKSEREMRQRIDEERSKAEEGARRRIEEEMRKLNEERRRAEEDSKKRAQEEMKRLEQDLQQKVGEESRRRLEEAKRKVEEEALRKVEEETRRLEKEHRLVEEDAKRKTQDEVKRIEQELRKREEEDRARRAREEAERKAQDEEQRRARKAKVEEFLSNARAFLSSKEFDDALIEVTKIYAIEPTSEEAKKVEGEIRSSKKQEEKRLAEEQKQAVQESARAAKLAAEEQRAEKSLRPEVDQKVEMERRLEEMKRQIGELTHALELEKKARVDVGKLHLEDAVRKFRSALGKAWNNGAPDGKTSAELHSLAVSLTIPPTVEQSLQREVKLEMYGRAVKVAIAKRNLIRSSSSTLDWLRNVYEVSLEEYLEYESKFLLDLVADQFKGTILLVSQDMQVREEVAARLKATGYAVVLAFRPEEALEKIEKLHPHFILCDVEFSQGSLSGVKFLQILRLNSKFGYTPFILFCEPKGAAEMESSELRPIEGFVKKPVKFEELTAEMDTKLARLREFISSLN